MALLLINILRWALILTFKYRGHYTFQHDLLPYMVIELYIPQENSSVRLRSKLRNHLLRFSFYILNVPLSKLNVFTDDGKWRANLDWTMQTVLMFFKYVHSSSKPSTLSFFHILHHRNFPWTFFVPSSSIGHGVAITDRAPATKNARTKPTAPSDEI